MTRNKFTVCYDVRIGSALNEAYATIIEKTRFITQDTKQGRFHDGHWWIYGSYQQLWENLFLNIETASILRRHINYLEKIGVLISVRCQYEKLYRINQTEYDRLINEGSEKLGARLPFQTVENQQSECADCQDDELDCQNEGVRLSEFEQSALYINKDKKKDREIEDKIIPINQINPTFSEDLQFLPLAEPPETSITDPCWNQALGQLSINKGQTTFDNVFRDLKFLEFSDGKLRIQARDVYNQKAASDYSRSIAIAYSAFKGIDPPEVIVEAPLKAGAV